MIGIIIMTIMGGVVAGGIGALVAFLGSIIIYILLDK